MKKLLLTFLSVIMLLTLTACGNSEGGEKNPAPENKTSAEKNSSEPAPAATTSGDKKILVAYFSCTGKTKALAENAASVLNADIYEIKPETPYTEKDLDWHDETTRATVEQRDENARPALADKGANISQYDTIVIAFPIWWGREPKIIDTFVESYDFGGKNLAAICTSGGSDIGTSGDYLKELAGNSANWKGGKCFFQKSERDEIKSYFDEIGIK